MRASLVPWNIRFKRLAVMLAAAVLTVPLASPASAHAEHRRQQAAMAAEQARQARAEIARDLEPMHANMGEMMDGVATDRSRMSLFERLVDWLGRTHPLIVHFPIAFFPAALFTAIVGRRRPAFAAPVQFLVIAGGLVAPVAALLGWFSGGWTLTDTDPLVAVHRWLGTLIGIGGLGLAVWAWRRPDQIRNVAMLVALTIMTAAIVAQGWYGGALVHGVGHMNW